MLGTLSSPKWRFPLLGQSREFFMLECPAGDQGQKRHLDDKWKCSSTFLQFFHIMQLLSVWRQGSFYLEGSAPSSPKRFAQITQKGCSPLEKGRFSSKLWCFPSIMGCFPPKKGVGPAKLVSFELEIKTVNYVGNAQPHCMHLKSLSFAPILAE